MAQLTPLLAKRHPIPIEFARIVLSRAIDPPDNIVARLRADYPTRFDAKFLAVIIESELLHNYKAAYDAALNLVDSAKTPGERQQLYFTLFEITNYIPADQGNNLESVAQKLLSDDGRMLSLARAGLALRSRDLSTAQAALSDTKDEDDPTWHQMQAQFLLLSGNADGAIVELQSVARRLKHPGLFGEIAELSIRQSRLPDARDALRELLVLDPRDEVARKRLAAIHAQLGEFEEAAKQFGILCESNPTDEMLCLNKAIALARCNALDASLTAYERACSFTDPSLHAIAGRAGILQAQGKSKEAFESLTPFKERFWLEWRFLLTYMQLGHAAGQEAEAHQAFLKLQQLKTEGKLPEGTLQEWSLDRLVELMGNERQRHAAIHQDLLRGGMPWLLIEIGARRGAYWGWRLRTQELRWLGDDPITRAEYCIYATNALHPQQDADGKRHLLPIQCPAGGTIIVADLSALITLHRLNLLDKVGTFFKQILVPSGYYSYALEEASSLVLHQLTRKTSVQELGHAIDAQRIVVADVTIDVQIPNVDEHTLESNEVSSQYRLRDVANDLRGRIPDDALRRLLSLPLHPERTSGSHPSLPIGGRVKFALSTLETLSSQGCLNAVLGLYVVTISPEDRNEVFGRLNALNTQEEVRNWQSALWQYIRQDSRFVSTPHPPTLSQRRDNGGESADVPFAAIFLANERNLPLLVDDRMFQASCLNSEPLRPFAAFGTDALLLQLHQSGILTASELGQHLLSLLRWRYRFLVPSPAALKSLSDKFRANLPGKDLQDVALYAHDCMRDPGLFVGPELTDPPLPMAVALYQAWVGNIAEFIVDFWQDETYTDDMARQLTNWALTELLPSPPRWLHEGLQGSTGIVTSRAVFGRAMVCTATAKDVDRANRALRAIGDAFHVDEAEYLRLVTGVIDAVDID
jgi:tetratricopeptide (TPR) repeat protein